MYRWIPCGATKLKDFSDTPQQPLRVRVRGKSACHQVKCSSEPHVIPNLRTHIGSFVYFIRASVERRCLVLRAVDN
jgi:hypothetical protein